MRAGRRGVAPCAIASTISRCAVGGPCLKRPEADAERHEPIDLREAALDQFQRESVARGGGDGQVEAHVGCLRFPVVVRRVARLRRRGIGIHRQARTHCDLLGGRQLRRARGGGAFEQPADVERVVNRTAR